LRTANFTKIMRTVKIRKTSEGPNENNEKLNNSQRYQEWLRRCQRDPMRTANFTRRMMRTARIRKISEGPNENYEN